MARDYRAAIEALNTLQPNFAAVGDMKKSGSALLELSIPETIEYLHRIGYKPGDLNSLNPIHIAGTKGKGSTSAFVSSILCQYARSSQENVPRKIGLYTSPHLKSTRERIRINHEPLPEVKFVKYFFEVWDRLETYAEKHGRFKHELLQPQGETKPIYFKFMTIMACHVYLQEGVDTAIFECGIGGEYDATNIIEAPTVCAVTSLGIDHVAMLGSTIESIAWHKAGIFKAAARCSTCFTVSSQLEAAKTVLAQRARDKQLNLEFVPVHPSIADGSIKLGLAAEFQKINASLAVAIVAAHLSVYRASADLALAPLDTQQQKLPAEVVRGLESAEWGGRCETRRESGIVWYIDGGHTVESIKLAAEWFASCLSGSHRQQRILLFNQQTRDAIALARILHKTLEVGIASFAPMAQAVPQEADKRGRLFDRAIFSTNVTFAAPNDSDGSHAYYKPDLVSMNVSGTEVTALTVQNELAQAWAELDPQCQVQVKPTIQEAVESIRSITKGHDKEADEVVVFATGSLHLVGGLLEILEATDVTITQKEQQPRP